MASPYNENEPESPDLEEEEGEEYIDTGFDAVAFWDQYRQVILVAGGVLLLALAGFGIYEYNQSQRIAAAGAALAQAASEDDYRQVMDKYAGTTAAGDASLALGGLLRGEGKYDEAAQVLQDFLNKYPDHPLAHAGDLSIAETLEAQGKADDAIAKYEEVAAKYPDSFSAPVAVLAEANILKSEGKIEEARRMYENFVAQFPNSEFSQEAMAEMHLLRAPSAASAAPAASDVNAKFLNAVRTALAARSPGASAAPAAASSPSASPSPMPPITIPGASQQ